MSLYDDASLVLIPSGYKEGKLYSIKPTDGGGDFTFSRASSGTRVTSSGLIEKETQNLLLQSNQFDTTWVNTNTTETGGQSGYDGSSDAWLLECTTTASSANIAQGITASGVLSLSFYAKSGTTDTFALRSNDSATAAWFNVSSGVVHSTSGSVIDAQIESVGSGWYRCNVVFDSCVSARLYISDTDGNYSVTSGANIYIQDAQLNQGLVADSYLETTTTAVYGGITDDLPRLDYTDASCPSLKLEPQRTNLVPYSEYGLGGQWTTSSATITQNATESPEGYNNAFEINVTSSSGSGYYNGVGVSASKSYTFSFYVKQGTNTENYLAVYDLSNNAFIDSDVSYTASSSEWTRITHKFTTPSGCTSVRLYPQRYTSGGIGTTFIYGVQLEEGSAGMSIPTSYIPTYGTAVTRVNDDCYGAGNATIINSTKGVLYAEIAALADDGSNRRISLNDGSDDNRINLMFTTNANQITCNYKVSGTTLVTLSDVLTDVTDTFKVAFKYSSGDFALWVNGVEIDTDTNTTMIADNTLDNLDFKDGLGLNNMFANVKQILYFPTALSDTELEELTTL